MSSTPTSPLNAKRPTAAPASRHDLASEPTTAARKIAAPMLAIQAV